MKKILLVLIITTFLVSCKKVRMRPCPDCFFFYFESPQPHNSVELDHFPHRFRGLYKNEDSTFLRIEEDRIIAKYFGNYTIHKLEFDSIKEEYVIQGNQVTEKASNRKLYIRTKGDSIEFTETFIDTIFRLSYYNKLKRIDGQLILSTKDSIFWKPQFLTLKDKSLKIKEIYLPNDLKKLDSVTTIKGKKIDSMSYLIRPTRSELKKILKIKNLGFDQEYKKISK
ncbi:hypothetical protein [Flavobacterium limi]|uniref:DKNYY family protein n=1 Tax=Flavobacterium limi TaxID=2045105 RepID=A0ABQ1UI59_9FLAO|nr:hypothetical protein [Flavobacterium limi]GGF17435.1 hypothetical protein GCM10011518_28540 [Flavobacterium limi]